MPGLRLMARFPFMLMFRAEHIRLRLSDRETKAAPFRAAGLLEIVVIGASLPIGLCALFAANQRPPMGPQFWALRLSIDCSSFVLALSRRHGRDNWRSFQPGMAA